MNQSRRRILIQVLLFFATFTTTTMAGSEWTTGRSIYGEYTWADFMNGMHFSIPFMLILTVHEFGHYFTARHWGVDATLPYYIPVPPFLFSIGTVGAVIRMRGKVQSKKQHFDIGIAGPLAGLVMALIVLYYGFSHLPPPEYIFQIHPEYEQYGLDYASHVYQSGNYVDVVIGGNLFMDLFSNLFADPERLPNPHELMHYPYLFAGFLALVITSLNLLPVGQLDGGHVLYGLFGGKGHHQIASIIFFAFMFYAGLGLEYIRPGLPWRELVVGIVVYVSILFLSFSRMGYSPRDTFVVAVVMFTTQFLLAYLLPGLRGYTGWLLFGFIVGRFIGVAHPPAESEEELDATRKMLGWFALIVFIMCFSMKPIEILINP